ncbi:phage tail tape measure protein, TP901 family [Paenibacillus sp. oral taxon 786 str. D14]|uniref:phage tail tape measure protein n=1 Tax=Paenibacillus sp. oral taxon 786 TaxID=652715 RepID=UPI0001AFD27E|nr:phage tail tape measure protein [Paenibacillus sp. oral taxon 786]EES73444.1 phage tail tape measure protein, TP901 family [Paenibacillus sp. oral taxon 786 str. D14]
MGLESVFRLSVIVSMIDRLSGPISRVNANVDNSVSRIDKLNESFGGMAKSGLAWAGIGAGIAQAALAPVEATFETQRALGVLKSMGVEDLKTLEDAATSFSNKWPGTTKSEFLRAATDIKGGIDSLTDEGVAQYTEIAGITAKATGATIDEMTSLFATGYGIYKGYYDELSDLQFGEMLSAGLAKSIQVFKASGKSMADSISTLGAAATSANVPLEEQLTVLGMLQATMSGSEAGTKYRAFLQSAARAGQELGLKFTDANNQLLSMPQILATLRSKFGETIDAAEKLKIQKAFGTDEAVALIDLLYNKVDNLQENILTIYDSMGQGTALAREMAMAINETEPEKFERLKQRLHNVTEELGHQLLPTFNSFMAKGEQWISRISAWIGSHQELAKAIMIVLLVIGSVLMVGGSLIAVIGGIGLVFTRTAGYVSGFVGVIRRIPDTITTIRIMAMYAGDGVRAAFNQMMIGARMAVTSLRNVAVGMANMARQAIFTAARAMPGLIASVWSFTAALLANPITWIVVGIVALVAALILLWQNWDSVVSWIQGVWNGFVSGISAGFDWIRNLFSSMPTWLQIAIAAFMPFIGIPLLIITHWDSIVAFFSNLWTRIKDAFVNGINAIKNFFAGIPAWFRESGAKIIDTMVEGIKSVAMKPVEAVKGVLQKVRNLLPFSDAKEGPLSELTLSGRRVFETIGAGMEKSQHIPGEITENAFAQMGLSASGGEPKKINLRETVSESSTDSSSSKDKENGTVIQQLVLNIDLNNLKDLQTLFKLLREIEDQVNANGATPSPA